jgi:mannan endo-1,4-beta-mannosidase
MPISTSGSGTISGPAAAARRSGRSLAALVLASTVAWSACGNSGNGGGPSAATAGTGGASASLGSGGRSATASGGASPPSSTTGSGGTVGTAGSAPPDAGAGAGGGAGGASASGSAGEPPPGTGSGGTGGGGRGGSGTTVSAGGTSGDGGASGLGGAGARESGGAGGGGGGASGPAGGSAGGAGVGGRTGLTTFVTRQGPQFMDGGKRYVFVGANFCQGMSLGSAGPGGDIARLRRELDRLKALGITNVRVVASAEGPDTEPYRIVPSLMPMPGVYNEDVFKGLDLFLDELDQRGIRAVMVLNNYWEWTGGMGQYVSWGQGTKIPYRLAPGGDYNTFIQYVDRFYACTTCQTMYRAHIQTVINRVNTVNGRTYRDDPTIFSWQLANEPRDYPATWIPDTAQYIKSLDPNHMVSVGSEGTWGGNFVTTHQSQYIDYTTCHIWVEPWGMYDPNNPSPAALQTATTFATGYLQDHDTAARQLGKPLILEEFGLARDGWTAGGKYDPAATVTNRDKYYRSLYAVVEASIKAPGGALAGDNFWAWGGEARPPSKLTGDPPHETPGWFSVYDQDATTLAVISAHVSAGKP